MNFRRQHWNILRGRLLRTKFQWIFNPARLLVYISNHVRMKILLAVSYSSVVSLVTVEIQRQQKSAEWTCSGNVPTAEVPSQAFGEAVRRNLICKATFIHFHLSRVFNDPLLQKVPCCYSSVLLNDPSQGGTLLNPRSWASGRQDELLGGWS